MYLTKQKIEEMGTAILEDFRSATGIYTPFTPIDQFAADYLGLHVKFAKLSDHGEVCGLTAYADTCYAVTIDGREHFYPIRANDIILDSKFIDTPEHVHSLCGMRRFTIAHECAHQILFRMEPEETKQFHKKQYAERRVYSCRELKSREDWNEWQANALGAALLMPGDSIHAMLQNYRLLSYAGRLTGKDQNLMETMSRVFGVSNAAMRIRLQNLGFMVEDPPFETSFRKAVTA